MMTVLDQYRRGIQPLSVGQLAAVHSIMAHANFDCYSCRFRIDSRKWILHALAAIPRILLEPPDVMSMGALLCSVNKSSRTESLVKRHANRRLGSILDLRRRLQTCIGYTRAMCSDDDS